jgi:aryl-alcohol dehydrogenase-like predicted oxidoreductase
MQTNVLGRTGLSVTVAGLGCGGFSRIGIEQYGEDHAAGIVRAAYHAGVNFFDTSQSYGTETAVGRGLAEFPRDSYVLSTKFAYVSQGKRKEPAALRQALDDSLRALKTDYIDVYHIHAVTAADYPWVREWLVPEMLRLSQEGKIRFLGVTERFAADTSHEMLKLAMPDNLFDVIMTGYNLLNPSAKKVVLPLAIEHHVGVLCMFAVRSALSNPEQLKIDLGRILASGQGGPGLTDDAHILDFLLEPDIAASLMDAAYRFCRHTPGVTITLTGTSHVDHLLENLRSIGKPPLPKHVLDRLSALFGDVDCVSGQ